MSIYDQLRRQAEHELRERITPAERRIATAKEEIAAAEEEIRLAQSQHEEVLLHIEGLEKGLPHGIAEPELPSLRRTGPEKKAVLDLICDVLPPKNVPFTLKDVLQWLTTKFPDRAFKHASVRTLVQRLMTEGVIIRLQKGGGDRRATFMVAGSDVDVGPFGDLTHVDIAEQIIQERGCPLKAEAIVKEMLAKGFEPTGTPEEFASSLESTMRKNRRFQKGETGWTVTPKKAKHMEDSMSTENA